MLNEFRRHTASMHLERGRKLERSGQYDEAMSEFKNAVEADPSYAAAHNALGYHYRRKGLLTKAIEEFKAAVNLAQDFESYFNLGKALFDMGRHTEARDAFQRCLSLSPGDPSARYELACTNYGLGKYSEALAEMGELASVYPTDWQLPFVVGSCYLRLGEYPQAEGQFRQALSLVTEEEDSWSIGDALSVAQRYQEFDPDRPLSVKDRFYKEYGAVYLGTGHDDGLEIPEYFLYNFDYQDIAVTLRRFHLLAEAFEWSFDALVSMDQESLPLTLALSELLDVPVREVNELQEDEFVLVVFGIGRTPELFQVTMERLPEAALSFGLSISWLKQSELVPDLLGISTLEESSLPWRRISPLSRQHDPDEQDRSGRAVVLKPPYEDTRDPSEIAQDILQALDQLPEEQSWEEQVDYYMREHSRLRFFQE